MSWIDIVTEAAMPLLKMLAVLALGALFGWLTKLASGIKQAQVRDAFTSALAELQTIVMDAIHAVNQMLVDDFKAASEDGKLTKEETAAAMRKAIDYIKSHLSPWALSVLQAASGPIDQWLRDMIEAKIGEMKWGEGYAITVPPSLPDGEPAPGSTV